MMFTRRQGLAAAGVSLAMPRLAIAQGRERPFRFVVNVGLQNLDPISDRKSVV